VGESWG